MTSTEKPGLKARLKEYCLSVLEQRVAAAQSAVKAAQEAANEEEKSSVGDKYETSRSMNQLNSDMYARQVEVNRAELAKATAVPVHIESDTVSTGSLVICSEMTFFIIAGLGRIQFEGNDYYMLSPNSPAAHLLMGRKIGEKIQLNNKILLIKDIF